MIVGTPARRGRSRRATVRCAGHVRGTRRRGGRRHAPAGATCLPPPARRRSARRGRTPTTSRSSSSTTRRRTTRRRCWHGSPRRAPFPLRAFRQATNQGPAAARNARLAGRARRRSSPSPTTTASRSRGGCDALLAAIDAGADIVAGPHRARPRPRIAAHGPFGRTMRVPREEGFYETCNIAYRREWLEPPRRVRRGATGARTARTPTWRGALAMPAAPDGVRRRRRRPPRRVPLGLAGGDRATSSAATACTARCTAIPSCAATSASGCSTGPRTLRRWSRSPPGSPCSPARRRRCGGARPPPPGPGTRGSCACSRPAPPRKADWLGVVPAAFALDLYETAMFAHASVKERALLL